MDEDLGKVEMIETSFEILSFLKKSSFSLFFSFLFLSPPPEKKNLNFAQFLEKVETIKTLFKILSFLKKSSFSLFFLLEKQRSSPPKEIRILYNFWGWMKIWGRLKRLKTSFKILLEIKNRFPAIRERRGLVTSGRKGREGCLFGRAGDFDGWL